MALRLMSYSFTILHKPGASNIADFLSRHPLECSIPDEENEVESYVAFIAEHATQIAISHAILIRETLQDQRLNLLKK